MRQLESSYKLCILSLGEIRLNSSHNFSIIYVILKETIYNIQAIFSATSKNMKMAVDG